MTRQEGQPRNTGCGRHRNQTGQPPESAKSAETRRLLLVFLAFFRGKACTTETRRHRGNPWLNPSALPPLCLSASVGRIDPGGGVKRCGLGLTVIRQWRTHGRVWMLLVYPKSERDDLSAGQLRQLAILVKEFLS